MSKLTFTSSSILYQMRDENLLFEPYGPDTIRVRATRNGTFSEEKWTLLDPIPADCTVEGDEHHASMTVGSLKVEVWKGWQRVHYRFLRDGSGEPYDVLCGTFFVVGVGREDFVSLTDKQVETYKNMYSREAIFRIPKKEEHDHER